jgi:hypothetical protein
VSAQRFCIVNSRYFDRERARLHDRRSARHRLVLARCLLDLMARCLRLAMDFPSPARCTCAHRALSQASEPTVGDDVMRHAVLNSRVGSVLQEGPCLACLLACLPLEPTSGQK